MEAPTESDKATDINQWSGDIRNNIKNIESLILAPDEDSTPASRLKTTLKIGHELGCMAASSKETYLTIKRMLEEAYKEACPSSHIGRGSPHSGNLVANQENQAFKTPEGVRQNQWLTDFPPKKLRNCRRCSAIGHNSRTCKHGATDVDIGNQMQDPSSSIVDGRMRPQRWYPPTDLEPERQKTCSQCKEKGHNSRTCSMKNTPVEERYN